MTMPWTSAIFVIVGGAFAAALIVFWLCSKLHAKERNTTEDTARNLFEQFRQPVQLQYPNPERVPASYPGGPVPISGEYSPWRGPTPIRPRPRQITVFTVSIPEAGACQDAPPSYAEVTQSCSCEETVCS